MPRHFPATPLCIPRRPNAMQAKKHFKFIFIVFKYKECIKRYEPIMCGRKPVVVDKTTRWRQDMDRHCFGHAYSDCSLGRTHHDEKVDLARLNPDPVGQQQSRWRRFHAASPRPATFIATLRTEYSGAAADRHWPAALAHA